MVNVERKAKAHMSARGKRATRRPRLAIPSAVALGALAPAALAFQTLRVLQEIKSPANAGLLVFIFERKARAP